MTEILFIEKAPTAGAEHRLEDGATIGRAGCDVKVDDPDVSRRHAIVRLEGAGVAVEDLGSTNGTFVNDARIEVATELRDGDHVRFGDVEWELSVPIQAVPAVETPGAPGTAAESTTPSFAPPGARFKRSAARRMEATVVSYGVVIATAVAVAAYFAQR